MNTPNLDRLIDTKASLAREETESGTESEFDRCRAELTTLLTRHEAMRALLERIVDDYNGATRPTVYPRPGSAAAKYCDMMSEARALLDAEKPAPRADSGGEGA